MKKINAQSDLIFDVLLGFTPREIEQVTAIELHIYTTDKDTAITKTMQDFQNWQLVIDSSELASVESGIINCDYIIKKLEGENEIEISDNICLGIYLNN